METTTLKIRQHLNTVSSRLRDVRTLTEKSELVGRTFRLENEIGLFLRVNTTVHRIWPTSSDSWKARPYNQQSHPHQCRLIILSCQLPGIKTDLKKGKRRVWGRWVDYGKMATSIIPNPSPLLVGAFFRTRNKILHATLD